MIKIYLKIMWSEAKRKFILVWPRIHPIFSGLNCEVCLTFLDSITVPRKHDDECLPFLDSIIAPATAHEVTAIHPLALYVTHSTSRPWKGKYLQNCELFTFFISTSLVQKPYQ